MRKPLLGVATGLLLVGLAVHAAQAAAPKPVAVVTIAGYDELMGDLKFVGDLIGRPELASGVDGMISLMTGGKGLEGLDTSKPAGAVIQVDGDRFDGYGFLPVKDLKKLLDVAEPLVGEISEAGGGVYQVDTNQGPTFFIKTIGHGWAVFCENRDSLDRAPADPGKIFAAMAKKYDMALRLRVHDIPEMFRRAYIAQVEAGVRATEFQQPGESDDDFALRTWSSQRTLELFAGTLDQLDELLMAWSVDRKAQTVHFDVDATVLPGSDSARWLSGGERPRSEFAGFLVPDAAMSANMLGNMPPSLTKAMTEAFGKIRVEALKEIERDAKSKQDAEVQKKLADELIKVLESTVSSGRVDGAMSLLLGPKTFTMVSGTYVADGPAIEKTVRQMIETARQENPEPFSEIKVLEAGKCEGVSLYAYSVEIKPDSDTNKQMARFFGKSMEMVFGVGEQSVYFAFGTDALKTLRGAIKRSAKQDAGVEAMSLSIAMKPFAQFMAVVGDTPEQREKAAEIAEMLEKLSGQDRMTLKLQSRDRGVHLRLEFEPDVLKLIGFAAQEE